MPLTKKLAIGGLNGFVSTEVLNSTSVLRISFSAKSPTHRQFSNRCDEIPSGFRHIARGLCDVRSPAGLRTSAGFAKGKTLRKAHGRWQQWKNDRPYNKVTDDRTRNSKH